MPSPVHPYSDYGVSLRTLRTARSWLNVLLFVAIILQFIGFGFMYWTTQPYESMKAEYRSVEPTRYDRLYNGLSDESSATRPVRNFFPITRQQSELNVRRQWDMTYTMLVPLTQIMGLIAVFSQAIIAFITLMVVLTAQAPGVAQLTRALIWAVLILFMIFPWQYFASEFPIPGVIYGYHELLRIIAPHVTENSGAPFERLLVILRFVVWPAIGLFALLVASERYRAGMMLAIGHPLQSMLQQRQPTPLPTPTLPR